MVEPWNFESSESVSSYSINEFLLIGISEDTIALLKNEEMETIDQVKTKMCQKIIRDKVKDKSDLARLVNLFEDQEYASFINLIQEKEKFQKLIQEQKEQQELYSDELILEDKFPPNLQRLEDDSKYAQGLKNMEKYVWLREGVEGAIIGAIESRLQSNAIPQITQCKDYAVQTGEIYLKEGRDFSQLECVNSIFLGIESLYYIYKYSFKETITFKQLVSRLGCAISKAGGSQVGAIQGAEIGTYFCPGTGTMIGGIIGGILGRFASGIFAESFASLLVNEDTENKEVKKRKELEFQNHLERQYEILSLVKDASDKELEEKKVNLFRCYYPNEDQQESQKEMNMTKFLEVAAAYQFIKLAREDEKAKSDVGIEVHE